MSSKSLKACCNETLASGPMAQIQRCQDCGTISIHLGATTVRLAPDACESLWATLSEALITLNRLEVAALGPRPRASVGPREIS